MKVETDGNYSSSRVIVKNLPLFVSSDESFLKEKFESVGQVTDFNLRFNKEGKFRHFAFIGYKNNGEAVKAVNLFNNTYLRSSKISVQIIEEQFKSFEERHLDVVKHTKAENSDKNVFVSEDLKKDTTFLEFLEASEKGKKLKKRIFENTQHTSEGAKEKMSDREYLQMKLKKKLKLEGDEITSDGVAGSRRKKDSVLFHATLYNLPVDANEETVEGFLAPFKAVGIKVHKDRKHKKLKKALISLSSKQDCDEVLRLKHKQKFCPEKSYYVEVEIMSGQDGGNSHQSVRNHPEKESHVVSGIEGGKAEDIGVTGRLFVRNLSYTCQEEDLEKHFSKFGILCEVNLPIDKFTKQNKGFAFITYVLPDDAVKAYGSLDKSSFMGRLLHLLPANEKAAVDEDDIKSHLSSYKKESLKKQKQVQVTNWNALFIRPNAIANLISKKYDLEKRDVLLNAEGDVAVNLALGESEIVQETKKFLEENGVSLKAFDEKHETKTARSKTTILAKNLCEGVDKSEIFDLFSKFGEIGRVLLPNDGLTAIIEFVHPQAARKAFSALSYSRFRDGPLFLEWAPHDLFVPGFVKSDSSTSAKKQSQTNGETDASLTKLFVKNLNFQCRDQDLKVLFKKYSTLSKAYVSMKKDSNKNNKLLSMGFGFVEFGDPVDANNALKDLQGKSFQGHSLVLQRSISNPSQIVKTALNQNKSKMQTSESGLSTKLLLRNLPFQATLKEVKLLFSPFGHVKSVRLPKKLLISAPQHSSCSDSLRSNKNPAHRGFAFIEFESRSDAEKAFESLSLSTHLYGRRLVLEWADSVDS